MPFKTDALLLDTSPSPFESENRARLALEEEAEEEPEGDGEMGEDGDIERDFFDFLESFIFSPPFFAAELPACSDSCVADVKIYFTN